MRILGQILQQHCKEVDAIFKDLLINLPCIFSCSETFKAHKNQELIKLMRERRHDHPLRIWIPDCATVKEAYSAAYGARDVMKKVEKYHLACNLIEDEHRNNAALLLELQVQQLELEMQNKQLSESQQALEEARDRYADLYDFAPVDYLTLDDTGKVIDINLTGAALLGIERLNLVGNPLINCLVTASVQKFMSHLRQTFVQNQESNRIVELQIKTKNGKPRTVNLESRAILGPTPMCLTIMTDVTEQRQMAIDLQLKRATEDALLGAIPALVFYLDTDLHFMNVSQTFAEFVGYKPAEITGKVLAEIFPQEAAEDLQNVYTSVLKTGLALYGFETTLPDTNGLSYHLSSVIAPFRDEHGWPLGLVGVSFDVSSYKLADRSNQDLLLQNRKLTRQLFAAQEAERRHIARELHDELGQWFTAIQAESQVICNFAKQHPGIHDSALSISKSTRAVHEVIRGMLRQLRPSLLDELGLEDSLRELQLQWCNTHPDIVCEFKLLTTLDGLGEELNLTIYRLIQESLNNIANHAGARRVTVQIQQELKRGTGSPVLALNITDDGAGFDTLERHEGIGLLGMRERVIALGGEFRIESTQELGTDVVAKLFL